MASGEKVRNGTLRERADFARVSREWQWITDSKHKFVHLSRNFELVTGQKSEEFIGKTRLQRIDVCDEVELKAHFEDLENRRTFDSFNYGARSESGELRWYRTNGQPVFDGNSTFIGYCGTATDITAIKVREKKARKNQLRFEEVQRIASIGVWELDLISGQLWWSEQVYRIFGLDPWSGVHDTRAFYESVHPDDRESVRKATEDAVKAKRPYNIVHRIIRANGEVRYVEENAECIYDKDGRPVALNGTAQDVTHRKLAEKALSESEELFRIFIDQMPAAVSLKSRDGKYLTTNQTFQEWFNPQRKDLKVLTAQDLVPQAHAQEIQELEQQVRDTRVPLSREIDLPLPDGTRKPALVQKFPLFDAEGSFSALGTIETDCSDLRRAEAKLQQVQKMETIGRLTGGIAHDFNNLLGIILGQIELAWEASDDEMVSKRLRVAIDAAERGARLTDQLLAFARKQTLEPTSLRIPELIAGMSDLLKQAVGKSIEIEVEKSVSPCWQVMADATQVENAILNLALNAKDAMPKGGRLTISMKNISCEAAAKISDIALDPGDYLLIKVTDTGSGMSEDLLTKATEPFFTTKPFGAGSGLGLSMVDGFVNQSGGRLQITSCEGAGTTIGLYLPRSKEQPSIEPNLHEAPANKYSANGQSVLVVEETQEVRQLLTSILRSLGYDVHEAKTAAHAMKLVGTLGGIGLIIADGEVSKQRDGRKLLRKARKRYPDLAVIYTIAAERDDEISSRKIGKNTIRLKKPIEEAALANLLCKALAH